MVCKFDLGAVYAPTGAVYERLDHLATSWGVDLSVVSAEQFARLKVLSAADALTHDKKLRDPAQLVEEAIAGVKRKAGILKKRTPFSELSHSERLELVARLCGFENWFAVGHFGKQVGVRYGEPLSHPLMAQLAICCWGAPEEMVDDPAVEHVLSRQADYLEGAWGMSNQEATSIVKEAFVVLNKDLIDAAQSRLRVVFAGVSEGSEGAALIAEVNRYYDTGNFAAIERAIYSKARDIETRLLARGSRQAQMVMAQTLDAYTDLRDEIEFAVLRGLRERFGERRWGGLARLLLSWCDKDNEVLGLSKRDILDELYASPGDADCVDTAVAIAFDEERWPGEDRLRWLRKADEWAAANEAPSWFMTMMDQAIVERLMQEEGSARAVAEAVERLQRVSSRDPEGELLRAMEAKVTYDAWSSIRNKWSWEFDLWDDEFLSWALSHADSRELRLKATLCAAECKALFADKADEDDEDEVAFKRQSMDVWLSSKTPAKTVFRGMGVEGSVTADGRFKLDDEDSGDVWSEIAVWLRPLDQETRSTVVRLCSDQKKSKTRNQSRKHDKRVENCCSWSSLYGAS